MSLTNTIGTNQYLGDIITRIGAICAGVTGVSRVFAIAPRLLRDVDLPSVVVMPRQVVTRKYSVGNVMEQRNIQLYLYFASADSGKEFERTEDLYNADLIDLLSLEFQQRPQLQLDDAGIVIQCRVLGDDGVQLLPYPFNSTTNFLGCVITIQIDRTYSAPVKRLANP